MAFGGDDQGPLRFIPRERPPEQYLDAEWAAFAESQIPTAYLNAFFWAHALSEKFGQEGLARQVPGFLESAYGFLDPEQEMPGFGIIAYTRDPRVGRPTSLNERAVLIGDHFFPLVMRYRRLIEHAPASPVGGTVTCYAVESVSRQFGALTARHVFGVDPQIGQIVQLMDGTVQQICAVAPPMLDAAMYTIDVPAVERDVMVTRLFPAPYEPVVIEASSSAIAARISAIGDTRGVLSPQLPCHFYLDSPGQPGDSGALVQSTLDGKALGLYRGEVATIVNTHEGCALSLAQVAQCMNITLLEP